MVDLYTEVFLGLLAVYVIYSLVTKLDGRLPVGAALVLLVVAAVLDSTGASGTANTLASYVFFLLAAGVFLLVVEHLRERRAAERSGVAPAGQPAAESREAPNEGDPTP